MLEIEGRVEDARYSDNLQRVIDKLDGDKILRLDYESGYQGYVDIDVLLSDGRIFSYRYDYGSCSGCDDWKSRNLSDEDIEREMINDATFFDDILQYERWMERKESQC